MRNLIAALFGAALIFAPVAASAQMHPDSRPGQNTRPDRDADSRYGRWDASWGARPSAPPRHWNKQNDWYRHVRACQQRYRSYNTRTDTYTVRRGVTRRCTL